MNASPKRADEPLPPQPEAAAAVPPEEISTSEAGFDSLHWQESRAEREVAGAGGRAVLAIALIGIAVAWTAYTAWSAGRVLSLEPLSSPAVAQWVAIAAGPLALLGLVWLMFGRTRRREAERFTRSVIAMRTEARSLESLLGILSQRIDDSRSELGSVAQQLMQLGDETSGRLGAVTRDLGTETAAMARHAEALDRAAESARTDIAVLLEDLPRAEAIAQAMDAQLRDAGSEARTHSAHLEQQMSGLIEKSREAEEAVAGAAQRLVTHLTQIESSGAAAAARVGEADASLSDAVDGLLERTATVLDEIRTGVDTQAAAVTALVEQASAGLGAAGRDAAVSLGSSVSGANVALDQLTSRLAEQERASQRITAETARALADLDQHFAALADQGDERASAFVRSVQAARAELDAMGDATEAQGGTIGTLTERTATLQEAIGQLSADVRDQLSSALTDAESGAARLTDAAQVIRPELEWMREAAVEASDRIAGTAESIAREQDRFAALMASIDEGVGGTETRLASLAEAIAAAQGESARLGDETAPALVAAMVQVRDAAAHAAERAREAIAKVIPESAESLSAATREALESAIREGIEERVREVEAPAARAVESAQIASERLTQQMVTLGHSAAALERHIEQTDEAQREKDSEAFARRVSLLIDSMHSAAIDVGKILSDEIDEKAWSAYLKGNRGVFTRRAVRLLDGAEAKAIRGHYEADSEFHQSVDRYVHDFESMLRRVLAERDGGLIAVTLMSSDMGKLYAALSQAIERKR